MRLPFQYINLINDVGVRESIFDEIKKIDNAAFTYKENTEPVLSYVQQLSKALQVSMTVIRFIFSL